MRTVLYLQWMEDLELSTPQYQSTLKRRYSIWKHIAAALRGEASIVLLTRELQLPSKPVSREHDKSFEFGLALGFLIFTSTYASRPGLPSAAAVTSDGHANPLTYKA